MTIRPIRTATDHRNALADIERLWGAKRGTAEFDRLDVLATLVEAYEREHYPIEKPTPIAALLFRMEQLGLANKDLEPFIGSRARVHEILKGKRELTLPMIRKLHTNLQIPAESLIGPSQAHAAKLMYRSKKSKPLARGAALATARRVHAHQSSST